MLWRSLKRTSALKMCPYVPTWGATRTADAAKGFEGAKIGVHPADDRIAKASVRIPPSSRVIDEVVLQVVLSALVSGMTKARWPRNIVSSRSSVHSPANVVSQQDRSWGTVGGIQSQQSPNRDHYATQRDPILDLNLQCKRYRMGLIKCQLLKQHRNGKKRMLDPSHLVGGIARTCRYTTLVKAAAH